MSIGSKMSGGRCRGNGFWFGFGNVDWKFRVWMFGFEKCRFEGLGSKMSIWRFGFEKCRLGCLGSKNVDWKVWVRKMSWVRNMFGFLKVWVRKMGSKNVWVSEGLGSKNVDLGVWVRKMSIGMFGFGKCRGFEKCLGFWRFGFEKCLGF